MDFTCEVLLAYSEVLRIFVLKNDLHLLSMHYQLPVQLQLNRIEREKY